MDLSKKYDDMVIAGEKPLVVKIGTEKRKLTIRCLPLEPWSTFQHLFGKFLLVFYASFSNFDWPEWEEEEPDKRLFRLRTLCQQVAYEEKLRKPMLDIIRRTVLRDPLNGWLPWWRVVKRVKALLRWGRYRRPSWGYIKREISPMQLMEIFVATYQYNIAAVKKNAHFLAGLLGVDLGECLSSSLRNLDGPTAKLSGPRFPNSPFISRDGQNPNGGVRILSPEEVEETLRGNVPAPGQGGGSGKH